MTEHESEGYVEHLSCMVITEASECIDRMVLSRRSRGRAQMERCSLESRGLEGLAGMNKMGWKRRGTMEIKDDRQTDDVF